MIYVALVGITLIIVRGTIFGRVRAIWPALLCCAQCTGAWVGAVGGAALTPLGYGCLGDAILVGGATSVLTLAADAVLLKLLGDPE